MSEHDQPWRSGEDMQALDNALSDTPLPSQTRNALLKRASISLLGLGGLGAVLAGCGNSSSSSTSRGAAVPTTTSPTTTSMSSAASPGSQIKATIDAAATAEALAVTYLTAVVTHPGVSRAALKPYLPVLKAANAQEYDHYKALTGLGAKPLATKFWVPKDFFGSKLQHVLPTLEAFETLFVNAYLIATTTFATAGKADYARYASEICGVESEHLALVRDAAHKLPNDVGFQDYSIASIKGIVSAIEATGVGFGQKTSKPGAFASFSPPPKHAVVPVTNNSPA